jgi:hypothetical protein
MGAFERQLQAVLDRLSARDPGPEHCGRGCICEADLDLNPGQGPDVPAPWNCSLDSDALAARTGQWRALAAAATSAERASGTVRLVLPAGPETITAVAALCAAETACCPHARFLLEVTAGQVTVTVKAAGTTGLPEALFPGQHAPSVMSTTAICLAVLAAAGLVLLLWAIGRAVTAARNRIPPPQRQDRHYLAGRLDRVQITDTLDYDGELLISLTTPDAPLTGVFCVTASACSCWA